MLRRLPLDGFKTWSTALICFVSCSYLVSGQQPDGVAKPDVKSILSKTRELYHNLKSYHFEHEIVIEEQGPGKNAMEQLSKFSLVIASNKAWLSQPGLPIDPNQHRLEINGQNVGYQEVSQENMCWFYTQSSNEYMTGKNSHYVSTSVGGSLFMGLHIWPFMLLDDGMMIDPMLIREEKVMLGKEHRNCFVIAGRLKTPTDAELGFDKYLTVLSLHGFLKKEHAGLYIVADGNEQKKDRDGGKQFEIWIDQQTHSMVRSKLSMTVDRMSGIGGDQFGEFGVKHINFADNFTLTKLNVELPESLFQFTVPKGAKEVPNIRSRKK